MNTILDAPDYVGPAGSWNEATPCSAPVFSTPIPGDADGEDPLANRKIVLRQDFQQWNEDWDPMPLSEPYGENIGDPYHDFLLVDESERVDIGGGAVKWTRTYAKIPTTHSERSTYSYTFPGYYGTFGFNVASPTGRSPFVATVNALVQYDYFLIDDALLEPIAARRYLVLANGAPEQEGLETDYLIDASDDNIATTPSRTEYQALIAANAFNIVARDSGISRYMGNIYRRETIYVKAQ